VDLRRNYDDKARNNLIILIDIYGNNYTSHCYIKRFLYI